MIDKDQNKLFKVTNSVKKWLLTRGNKRQWPRELKIEIVALIRNGWTITEVSTATGILCGTIKKWSYQKKTTNLFRELAVIPITATNNISTEIRIETAQGHLVTLQLSALSELFQMRVL